MSMPKFFITIIGAVSVIIFFQNCQKAKMSTSGAEQSSLTGLGASSSDLNGLDNDPPPNDPGSPDDDDDDDVAGNPGGNDDDDDNGNGGGHCTHDNNGHENGAREYVCVIAGPGESTHIGITSQNSLEAKHEGPKMLCMTKSACEVQGARAFSGAHAEFRGFCKNRHNKNVKHISDANMKLLVDKYILANPNGPQSSGHNNGNKN